MTTEITKKKGKADNIDKYAGEKLREARLHAGLSQEKVADALKITFQQVQKYERGTNRMSASRLYSLSILFHLDVGYFFPHAKHPKPKSLKEKLSNHQINTIKSMDTMDSDMQKAISKIVKTINKTGKRNHE